MTITPKQIVQNHVLCCVSGLVATLADGYHFIIIDRKQYPGGPMVGLLEQAFELASPVRDYEEAAIQAGWTRTPEGWWWREPTEEEIADDDMALFHFLGSGPFVRADTLEEACERDNIEPFEREVYEHWAVTDWLADKLEAEGEKVDRGFAGLPVWARTTTGQAIYADGVIEAIAADLGREG